MLSSRLGAVGGGAVRVLKPRQRQPWGRDCSRISGGLAPRASRTSGAGTQLSDGTYCCCKDRRAASLAAGWGSLALPGQ